MIMGAADWNSFHNGIGITLRLNAVYRCDGVVDGDAGGDGALPIFGYKTNTFSRPHRDSHDGTLPSESRMSLMPHFLLHFLMTL